MPLSFIKKMIKSKQLETIRRSTGFYLIRGVHMKKTNITREELARCEAVAFAFSGMFDDKDISIVKDKKYGYFILSGIDTENACVDDAVMFSSAEEMFKKLWDVWYYDELRAYAKKSEKEFNSYEKILADMPQEMKDDFDEKKAELKKVVDIACKLNDQKINQSIHKYSSFVILAGVLINLYAAIRKKTVLSIISAVLTGISAGLCIFSGHKLCR